MYVYKKQHQSFFRLDEPSSDQNHSTCSFFLSFLLSTIQKTPTYCSTKDTSLPHPFNSFNSFRLFQITALHCPHCPHCPHWTHCPHCPRGTNTVHTYIRIPKVSSKLLITPPRTQAPYPRLSIHPSIHPFIHSRRSPVCVKMEAPSKAAQPPIPQPSGTYRFGSGSGSGSRSGLGSRSGSDMNKTR